MAQSRNFFGLRRGSTKSHTYSVLNGKQITKDRVFDVSNPQTNAQMRTRLAFATVAKAGAALTDLVGISFQGITSIADSRRKFSSINASKLIAQLKANAGDGVLVPKHFSVLVPNKYVVADGTLRNATLGVLSVNEGEGGVDYITQPGFSFTLEKGVAYSADDILGIVYGCEPGDQITVVGITSGDMVDLDEPSLEILRDGQMYSARVVFKEASILDALPALTIAADATPQSIPQLLQEYIVDLIDLGKSYSGMTQLVTIADNFTAVAGTGDNIEVTFALNNGTTATSVIEALGNKDIFAVGYFRSHLAGKTWMFSHCELTVIRPVYNQTTYDEMQQINYGYKFDVALSSYLKSSSKESIRYTEAGGSANTLGF